MILLGKSPIYFKNHEYWVYLWALETQDPHMNRTILLWFTFLKLYVTADFIYGNKCLFSALSYFLDLIKAFDHL